MTLFLRLIPASFSEVPHSEIVRVFHEIVKLPMIPEIKSNNMGLQICENLVTPWTQDNGSKNDHPLRVPLPITNPVKLYRQDSQIIFPTFPEGAS